MPKATVDMAARWVVAAVLLQLFAAVSVSAQSCGTLDADVLILGAGLAGLRAAESFHDAGRSFLVLEQANRIGGRVLSTQFAGATVEQGPKWILWVDRDVPDDMKNPLLLLAEQCGLQFRSEAFPTLGLVVYDRNGNDISNTPEVTSAFARIRAAQANAISDVYNSLQGSDEDFSLQSAYRLGGWDARTPLEEFVEWQAVDGAFGAGTNEMGLRGLTLYLLGTSDFGDVDVGVIVTDPRGYIHLVNCFTERFLEENDPRIHLNTIVTGINWSGDDCVCATVIENGVDRQYCGSYAVVTFSTGVLQSGSVTFEPEPPMSWTYTLHRGTMAHFLRVYAEFNETFWDTNVDTIAYFDETQVFREYYSLFFPQGSFLPGQPPILEAILTGDFALRVASQDAEITRQQISEIMQNIYGDKASDALSVSLYPYITSPYYRGNLAVANTGFIEESYDILAGPLGRMYFAGDGVSGRYHATTHGAYLSGRDTAARILQDMADNAALQLQFDNETPMVVGNSIFAEFSVSRSVETLDCRLAGLPRQNCKGGYLLAYM